MVGPPSMPIKQENDNVIIFALSIVCSVVLELRKALITVEERVMRKRGKFKVE